MLETPGQKHARLKQRKAKAQKYFDKELRTTNAQRNSFSLSKTSFSPKRADRSRGPSVSHPKGPRPKHVGGLNGQWRRKTDKPVLCRTVEQPIRSGGKSEGCTVRGANASEPRNPNEMLRGTSLPAVKQEYRSQLSPGHGASC